MFHVKHHERLVRLLDEARRQGFLGAGAVEDHIEHGRAHAKTAGAQAGQRWCDLGSGAGVPGLVLALEQPEAELVLMDRSVRRVEFLQRAIAELDLGNRTAVALGDASELAHADEHRGTYHGVVSRSFGAPAVVAECSAGLLKAKGRLVVSEPPEQDSSRWPAAPLAILGLRFVTVTAQSPRFAILERLGLSEDSEMPDAGIYPRPWKRISKKPLY